MSTPQPPNGAPDGEPGFAPPQDPWSGVDPAIASVPTDPIPQAYNTGPTVAANPWTVPTVPPGGPPQPPGPPASRSGGRTGFVVTLVVVVLLLGGGGAYAAYKYLSKPTSSPGTATSPTTAATLQFPYTVQKGDCVRNIGTQEKPALAPASCSEPGTFKVVRIARGRTIPVGPSDKFDADTTSTQVCAGIDYQNWYGLQQPNADDNLFFCLAKN
jgi:hypothetical protein